MENIEYFLKERLQLNINFNVEYVLWRKSTIILQHNIIVLLYKNE